FAREMQDFFFSASAHFATSEAATDRFPERAAFSHCSQASPPDGGFDPPVLVEVGREVGVPVGAAVGVAVAPGVPPAAATGVVSVGAAVGLLVAVGWLVGSGANEPVSEGGGLVAGIAMVAAGSPPDLPARMATTPIATRSS